MVPHQLGNAECTPRITGCRLYPNLFERTASKKVSIRNTIQCDSSSETEIFTARLIMQMIRSFQHNLFCYFLNRCCQIHIKLTHRLSFSSRLSPKKSRKATRCHPQTMRVFKILQIQTIRTILKDLDQLRLDQIYISWLSVGGKPHQLVLISVHTETTKIGEC